MVSDWEFALLRDGRRKLLSEGAEAGYGGGDEGEGSVDLVGGGEAGEGEAEAGAGMGGGEAHGEEDVGGLGGAGLAGGTEAGGDALHVKCDEEGFGVDSVEAEVGGVGRAVSGGAVDVGSGNGDDEALLKAVAQDGELLRGVGAEPGEG